jgi:hypothetical protein
VHCKLQDAFLEFSTKWSAQIISCIIVPNAFVTVSSLKLGFCLHNNTASQYQLVKDGQESKWCFFFIHHFHYKLGQLNFPIKFLALPLLIHKVTGLIMTEHCMVFLSSFG